MMEFLYEVKGTLNADSLIVFKVAMVLNFAIRSVD